MLCCVPALRVLRQVFPDASITLIGLPGMEPFAERFNRYFDVLLPLPGFPGLPEQPPHVHEFGAFLGAAQAQEFDLALQWHGSGRIVNSLIMLLGAAQTAGFYLEGDYCPDPATFLRFDDEAPEVMRPLRLLAHLGLVTGDANKQASLEFPLNPTDYQQLEALPEAQHLLPGTYFCVHPGASRRTRRWREEDFAHVINKLADETGLSAVLTGLAVDKPITDAVTRHLTRPATDLAGRTSLGALAALIKGAELVISNDTGVAHLADALDVPSITIYLTSNRARWASLHPQRHRAVGKGSPADLMADDAVPEVPVGPNEVMAQAVDLLTDIMELEHG